MRIRSNFRTSYGQTYVGDSLNLMQEQFKDDSVDLIMTSPPFGLVRKKSYGNVESEEYVAWFKRFGSEFNRILKANGSLVIDIGGAWIPGQPTRSLYQYELLVMLCKDIGFHLAQEFFWWNPAKLPTPAEWVTVRRVRCKDAINCVWWLSKTPWPKASNRRVLAAYSDSMHNLLKNGYKARLRPSGHDISAKFQINNGGAIPPNLLAFPNTESNSFYMKYCAHNDLAPHPARFPSALPEFFIRMLTNRGDLVFDPFAGSCVTGEAAEKLERRWVCCDLVDEYIRGAQGRFERSQVDVGSTRGAKAETYSVPNPLAMASDESDLISADGGKKRALTTPRKRSPDNGTLSILGESKLKKGKVSGRGQMRLLEEHAKYSAKRRK